MRASAKKPRLLPAERRQWLPEALGQQLAKVGGEFAEDVFEHSDAQADGASAHIAADGERSWTPHVSDCRCRVARDKQTVGRHQRSVIAADGERVDERISRAGQSASMSAAEVAGILMVEGPHSEGDILVQKNRAEMIPNAYAERFRIA